MPATPLADRVGEPRSSERRIDVAAYHPPRPPEQSEQCAQHPQGLPSRRGVAVHHPPIRQQCASRAPGCRVAAYHLRLCRMAAPPTGRGAAGGAWLAAYPPQGAAGDGRPQSRGARSRPRGPRSAARSPPISLGPRPESRQICARSRLRSRRLAAAPEVAVPGVAWTPKAGYEVRGKRGSLEGSDEAP